MRGWGLGSAVEHFVKTHCVSKATMELTILLPQLPECLDYRPEIAGQEITWRHLKSFWNESGQERKVIMDTPTTAGLGWGPEARRGEEGDWKGGSC